jgi:hypothetical protein
MPRHTLTRSGLLLAGGSALAGLAVPPARAAPDEDLALLRLAAPAELIVAPWGA